MNRFAKPFLTLSAVALLGTSAVYAQGMGGGDCHAGFNGEKAQKLQQRIAQRHEQHQKELKAALKLTAEQEGAWNQFTQAMQHDPKAMPRFDRAEWDKLTTPQRMEKMQALRSEREAHMNQRLEAVKKFYATLTPEQQKAFDEQHQRMGRHGDRKGGQHGSHGPMHG